MFIYLGHTIAGVGYRGKARDALFAALQAEVAAYTMCGCGPHAATNNLPL